MRARFSPLPFLGAFIAAALGCGRSDTADIASIAGGPGAAGDAGAGGGQSGASGSGGDQGGSGDGPGAGKGGTSGSADDAGAGSGGTTTRPAGDGGGGPADSGGGSVDCTSAPGPVWSCATGGPLACFPPGSSQAARACYRPGAHGAPPSPCLDAADPRIPALVQQNCVQISNVHGPSACASILEPGDAVASAHCCYAADVSICVH